MTHAPHADPAQAAGDESDAGALGQAIASRLFSAGLDLHFALALAGDGPAARRLEHAVAQLDEAIKELRQLMLALLAPAEAAVPDDGPVADIRSRRAAQAARR